jgi:hypothetical protein
MQAPPNSLPQPLRAAPGWQPCEPNSGLQHLAIDRSLCIVPTALARGVIFAKGRWLWGGFADPTREPVSYSRAPVLLIELVFLPRRETHGYEAVTIPAILLGC